MYTKYGLQNGNVRGYGAFKVWGLVAGNESMQASLLEAKGAGLME